MMHGHEKSDPAIVAGKSANKGRHLPAESMEPRAGAEGNAIKRGMRRTPSRESMSHGLDRVRQAAQEQKGERFTALLHHIDVGLLRSAYGWLRKRHRLVSTG
jgi:RNA-directed DNA polymerase